MRHFLCILTILICGSLLLSAQTATDTVTITKNIEEVVITRERSRRMVTQDGSQLQVDMQDLRTMPKFLGASDPIRYLQSLPGIQTNNETRTGLHIQGCDDYQTLTAINGAAVYYPNHLLGLFSTFIGSHFSSITIEQAEHTGNMTNRIGGYVNFETPQKVPERFSLEGNLGLVFTDLTLAIPIKKKSALWLSGRTSYINMIYGKWLKIDSLALRYNFQDYNLTYAYEHNDSNRLIISGFYSRDKMGVGEEDKSPTTIGIRWQNFVGSAYWDGHFRRGEWRSGISFSGFDNKLAVKSTLGSGEAYSFFGSAGINGKVKYLITDKMDISAAAEYIRYFSNTLDFTVEDNKYLTSRKAEWQYTDEASLSADFRHQPASFFAYNAGLHLSLYAYGKSVWFQPAPRLTLHFYPYKGQEIALHYGMYEQNFHKTGMTSGGLPTDYYVVADTSFVPEKSHSLNLRYTGNYFQNKYSVSVEGYFKQIYNITESMSNPLSILNADFDYRQFLLKGDGRNYGISMMLQKKQGYVTGYVAYTLGWAKRRLPELDGSNDYIYSASHERRHDLKIVLNSQVAKRWNISAMFVLSSGLPYTKALEAYLLNGKMICRYSTYNSGHLPLYHRLDISVSYDIIKRNGHELGINVSAYNVYNHHNAQFMVYRENLRPIYGSSMSIIIPSLSIYGKF